MKLAIKIPTFYHKDGGTYKYLHRALTSIKNQTHQDYMVYLIGDDYEKPKELEELSRIIDPKKMRLKNLPVSIERSKYRGAKLWAAAGITPYNTAVDMALKDNIPYICNLDHDDYWEPNHLQLISDTIEETKTNFICTKAIMGKNGAVFPNIKFEEKYTKFIPKSGTICHSSTCVNFEYFGFRYRNLVELFNRACASDGDLWTRIAEVYNKKNEHGILINKITCYREQGREVILRPEIV
jgi:glycosyltransferase involved in cell wall biosynthesis